MKAFLSTTKGKAIAGVITLVIVGAVIAAVLLMNGGYRTIAVAELNGTTHVVNKGTTADAYVGQHLESGDDVTVADSSDLTLELDSDKHVFATEKTHFWIEATGNTGDTKTTIHLAEGSTLNRIDNKLAASESYDVETSNATMSVRGTVFGVNCYKEAADTYTVIDVYEGEVFVQVKLENGQNTEESRLLEAGERAIVHSNSDNSEFIKDETEIEYHKLTQNGARFLGNAIDDGRVLSIGKDLLFDIVEINAHDFSEKSEVVEATCTEEGYYYDICSVCGAESEKHIIDKLEHNFVASEADDTKMICADCGYEEANTLEKEDGSDGEITPTPEAKKNGTDDTTASVKPTATPIPEKVDPCAKGHTYERTTVDATCTNVGMYIDKCKYCGNTVTTNIPALGHSYESSSTPASCTSDGYKSEICSRCGDGGSETISATGHSYSWSSDVSGHVYTCGNCGDSYTEGHSMPASGGACTVCGWM